MELLQGILTLGAAALIIWGALSALRAVVRFIRN